MLRIYVYDNDDEHTDNFYRLCICVFGFKGVILRKCYCRVVCHAFGAKPQAHRTNIYDKLQVVTVYVDVIRFEFPYPADILL